eukprot:2607073-Amphidinium_carterae.1
MAAEDVAEVGSESVCPHSRFLTAVGGGSPIGADLAFTWVTCQLPDTAFNSCAATKWHKTCHEHSASHGFESQDLGPQAPCWSEVTA